MVRGKPPHMPGQSAPARSQNEIEGGILLMRSGGREKVLYPDSGKELACHQLTLIQQKIAVTQGRFKC